jgi:hypothetical protein
MPWLKDKVIPWLKDKVMPWFKDICQSGQDHTSFLGKI